nr:uncharacterized protein LOC117682134 [Crassostrea gigas]
MSTESTNSSTSNRDVTRESQAESNSNSGQDFDVIDAVSLFNSRLDAALEKQKTLILSEVQDKLKPTNSLEFRGEGNKIQFNFNEERLRGLELLSQKLISGDFSGITDLISSEKVAIRQRNKILRIAVKQCWGTAKDYVDSDIADNSEDAARLRTFCHFKSRKQKSDNLRTKDRVSREIRECSTANPPAAFSWECKIQQPSAVRAEIQLAQLQKTLTSTDRKHRLPLLSAPWSLRKILPVYPAVPVYRTHKPQSSALVPTSTANQQ